MSDQLPMFEQMTSPGTLSVTSSRESASGPTRSDSPDGQTTAKSGQAPVPANPSARPAKAKRSTMKGIFGQTGFHSSKHEDLSYALANRLRQSTDSLGSTLFNLTWTVRITPAGRSISALRASEPLTEGSVCIGWPMNLQDQVRLAGWKTPCVPNGGRISGNSEDIGKHRDGTKAQIGLEKEAKLSGWQTPTCNPATYTGGNAPGFLPLPGEVKLSQWDPSTDSGGKPIGYLLGPNGWEIVPASGQLNAAHSRWLMGLPKEWDDCGVTAMASLRKLRKRSSNPTCP